MAVLRTAVHETIQKTAEGKWAVVQKSPGRELLWDSRWVSGEFESRREAELWLMRWKRHGRPFEGIAQAPQVWFEGKRY